MTTTHTYVELGIDAEAFDDIARRLREAGYVQAFVDMDTIDMHGIALVREEPESVEP